MATELIDCTGNQNLNFKLIKNGLNVSIKYKSIRKTNAKIYYTSTKILFTEKTWEIRNI